MTDEILYQNVFAASMQMACCDHILYDVFLLLKWQYMLGTLFTSDLLYLCIVLHTPTHFLSVVF